MNFELSMPSKIIFSCGAFNKLSSYIEPLGSKALIICSSSAFKNGVIQRLQSQTDAVDFEIFILPKGEPTPQSVTAACEKAVQTGAQIIIGIGGGSAIDTAKAVSGLVTNGGNIVDYLEGVGNGATVRIDPLPFIAVPTTSGTGAEATKNAVISDFEKGYKKSFRSDKLLPRLALIDPELTVSVSPDVTASCGMDAITQVIESYTSIKSNPLTKEISLLGIKKIPSLLSAYKNGNDIKARTDMSYCALLSGIALANSGLGAAHGFAAGLGACANISHGKACAILLPHVMRLNREAAAEDYAVIGNILTGKAAPVQEAVNDAIEYIVGLNKAMNIPEDFKYLNIKADALMVAKASMGGSMTGNPVKLDVNSAADFIAKLI